MQPTALPRLMTARIIAASIAAGPVILWIVAWVITSQSGEPAAPADAAFTPELAMWIWAAVAVSSFAAGLFFRYRAVSGVDTAVRSLHDPARDATQDTARAAADAETASDVLAALQTNLVVAWALFEGPALLSGVFFLLFGMPDFINAGAILLAAGMIISFPRRDWFEPFERVVQQAEVQTGS